LDRVSALFEIHDQELLATPGELGELLFEPFLQVSAHLEWCWRQSLRMSIPHSMTDAYSSLSKRAAGFKVGQIERVRSLVTWIRRRLFERIGDFRR
jgi:hypothetical protein